MLLYLSISHPFRTPDANNIAESYQPCICQTDRITLDILRLHTMRLDSRSRNYQLPAYIKVDILLRSSGEAHVDNIDTIDDHSTPYTRNEYTPNIRCVSVSHERHARTSV